MITTNAKIRIIDSVSEAPKYTEDTPLLKIDTVLIVKEGMESGGPSVDIQLVDDKGKKYVIMASGGILASIGSVVQELHPELITQPTKHG